MKKFSDLVTLGRKKSNMNARLLRLFNESEEKAVMTAKITNAVRKNNTEGNVKILPPKTHIPPGYGLLGPRLPGNTMLF